MNEQDKNNIALLALLRACHKPDTWSSIANQCIIAGNAIKVYRNAIDPVTYPLFEKDDASFEQGTLFNESSEIEHLSRRTELENAWRLAEDEYTDWNNRGLDFLNVLDADFPERLRSIIDVPPFLFYKGKLQTNELGVSVVGSRKCTPEGMAFAQETAHMLVDNGLTVIAGLAEGIDTFAHTTALESGGRTVAFIGTGICRQYPPSNKDLQHEIEQRGLVFSQFYPDTAPTRKTFPMRNTLMSGYGIATVIVEAHEYSGTRIQARKALQHGRPVIIRRNVVDSTEWAKTYVGKPGVYVVDSVEQVEQALREIKSINSDADEMLQRIHMAQGLTA